MAWLQWSQTIRFGCKLELCIENSKSAAPFSCFLGRYANSDLPGLFSLVRASFFGAFLTFGDDLNCASYGRG